VAKGFEEEVEEKKDAPTVSTETIRIIILLAQQRKWDINAIDIKTAYLQGKHIKRRVVIKPPKEFDKGKLWLLKKTVYGLKDAAMAWYLSLKEELLKMGLRQSPLESTLFILRNEQETLQGAMYFHVDDILWVGNQKFKEEIINRLASKFEIGSSKTNDLMYLGVRIFRRGEEIILNQEGYLNKIYVPNKIRDHGNRKLNQEEITKYRSLLGQMNWLARNTRPETSYAVSKLSVGENNMNVSKFNELRMLARKTKSTNQEITYKKLGKDIKIVAFSDASYANIEEARTQLGNIILIQDNEGKIGTIMWSSNKSKRVNKSVLEAEANSLSQAIENAIYYKDLWKDITAEQLKIEVRTDSKTLQASIYSERNSKIKTLRVNIGYIKEQLKYKDINEIKWIVKEKQLADALTKEMGKKRLLQETLTRGNFFL
jgi:ribosomal protein L22